MTKSIKLNTFIKEANNKKFIMVDEFMDFFTKKYNSAAELWLSSHDKKKLMRLYNSGKKLLSKIGDYCYNNDYLIENESKKYKSKGWKLFDFELNILCSSSISSKISTSPS